MAYTTINKSTDYFNTKLYTGNGGTNNITGIEFQPDFVWLKSRNVGGNPRLVDSIRGTEKRLMSNTSNAESTETGLVTSFNSDGFTLNSSDAAFNGNGNTYASWNWLANGTGSANTDGTINTTVSANTTSGFSIISYTGTGGTSQTLGHGLGVKPKMFIVKCRSNAGEYWGTWIDTDGDGTSNYRMSLNATDAAYGSDPISFSNSLITLPSSANTQWNGSGRTYVGYAFAEKQGYSKFGSYTGNGNADGTFIYTGFKPAWVMYKVSSTTSDWYIQDNKRLTYNVNNTRLEANNSDAEVTGAADSIDMLSNGFKMRNASASFNASGATYIYMAFAEAPLVGTNNVPCTAR